MISNSSEYIVETCEPGDIDGAKGYYVTLKDIFTDNLISKPIFILDHGHALSLARYNKTAEKLIKEAKAAKTSKSRSTKWMAYFAFTEAIMPMINTGVVAKSIDYGYALTVHKSQGSTYTNVIVDHRDISKCLDTTQRNKLLYVALSRPRLKAFVIS